MKSKPDLMTRLADAAIAWIVAKRVALALKDQRDPIECDQLMVDNPMQASDGTMTPCWKRWKEDRTHEGFDRAAILTWCPSCQRRQRLTDELRRANQVRGAKLRELHRLATLTDRALAEIREQLTAALARVDGKEAA